MAVTPSLQNDIRRVPGNLLLVDKLHIGVARLQGLDGKITIMECTGESGEVVALALVDEAVDAVINGLNDAKEHKNQE